MWILWFVLVFIAALAIHYMFVPVRAELETYRLNELILQEFTDQINELKQVTTEAEYLKTIQDCMKDSKALSNRRPKRKSSQPEKSDSTDSEEILDAQVAVTPLTKLKPKSAPAVAKAGQPGKVQPFRQTITADAADQNQPPAQEDERLSDAEDLDNDCLTESDNLAEIDGSETDESEDATDELFEEPEDDDDPSEEEEMAEMRWRIERDRNGRRILEQLDNYDDNIESPELFTILQALDEFVASPDERSIVRGLSEDETKEYSSSFDLLYEVRLTEHVANVVEELVKQFSSLPGIAHRYVSDFFLMGVYHDLGKLKKYRDGSGKREYRMLDHPVISSQVLQERLPDVKEAVVKAIAHHHKPTKVVNSKYHDALKKADGEARRQEIKARAGDVPEMKERLPKDQLIQLLIDSYMNYASSRKSSPRPPIAVVRGYLLIQKLHYFSEVEKALHTAGGLCREQMKSREQFESSALALISDYQLVSTDVLNSVVSLEIRKAGKTRSLKFFDHFAIPIEALRLVESTLPEDEFGRNYTGIQFEKRASS